MAQSNGRRKLTTKQKRVRDLCKQGKGPTEIAKITRSSPNAVSNMVRILKEKGELPKTPGRRGRPPARSTNGNGHRKVGPGHAKAIIENARTGLEAALGEYQTEVGTAEGRVTAIREDLERETERLDVLKAERDEIDSKIEALA